MQMLMMNQMMMQQMAAQQMQVAQMAAMTRNSAGGGERPCARSEGSTSINVQSGHQVDPLNK
jgi:hypothetical protein